MYLDYSDGILDLKYLSNKILAEVHFVSWPIAIDNLIKLSIFKRTNRFFRSIIM